MKGVVLGILILTLSTSTSPALAAVFERDWKTPGDGLLTYDDVNQREWLDLSVSAMDQFPEPRLQNALMQIAPGGIFEGFVWAKRSDVLAFAQSAGIDTNTGNLVINQAPTNSLIQLLGLSVQTLQSTHSVGFIDEINVFPGFPPRQLSAGFLVDPTTGGIGQAGLRVTDSDDLIALAAYRNGIMLFRNIPEQSSLNVMLVGIWLLMYFTAASRIARAG